ncbi:MAG: HD domain-containing protein [Agarilytica sp.]
MDQTRDFYGYRLAEVNETNPVTAASPIYNDQGVLLMANGKQLTRSQADVIAQHKLIKPLEHSVNVTKSLDSNGLFELIEKFSSQLPGLHAVAHKESVRELLKKNCKYYAKHPLLRQKLTVLASQLPNIYYGSLYSAVAGVVLAEELKLDDKEIRTIFIGGLMHNVGFLHLDPELTKNEDQLEKDETITVQAHPVIAKHFLDNVPGLSKEVGKAVLDHHERTDGTGYPRHRFGVDLSITSQVIAFTDELVRAYKQCEHYGAHAHPLMMLILQFNSSIHFESVYKAAACLMKRGPNPDTPPNISPKAQTLVEQQMRITETFNATKKLAFVLMKNTRTRTTKSIASMLGRLATSIISAGITQEEYREWLEDLARKPDPEEALELLKSKIMQDEIEMQIERFKSIMWQNIKQIPKEDDLLLENCIRSYNQIDRLKVREESVA